MANLIESLESRVFLSATPAAVSTLFAQGKVVVADGKAVTTVDVAGLRTISADLKAAKLLKTDALAIRVLVKGNAAAGKVVANSIKSTESFIGAESKKLVADGNALAKKPTNAKLIAAVAALKTLLSTKATNALISFTTDANAFQSTIDTDSTAIATANPTQATLGGAINNYQSSVAGVLQTLQNAVSNALTTDVADVVALY